MHDYSIDKHPKEKVLFALSFIAISIAAWVNGLLKSMYDSFHWVYTAIPISLVFGGIYWVFNNKLWKAKKLRKVMLIPDLNGEWECEGHQFLKNGENVDFDWKATITIVQSWSKMVVNLKTHQSASHSVSASINHEEGNGYRLLFVYENTPKAGEESLARHTGTCDLVFNLKVDGAEGAYFTDQDRKTAGNMTLKRKVV